MLKIFPIDFIRQILEQTLYKEHLNNEYFFGGYDQVNIHSFYEQLKGQDEVDRFVETYRDLSDQQNRTGLILNGVVLAPENPTITNLYSSLIIPLTWTCSIRCSLANRDQATETINNLISELKGRKVDIAQLKCIDAFGKYFYTPFIVGTIGENDGAPIIENGDYIGDVGNANMVILTIAALGLKGVGFDTQKDYWLYCKHENKLKVVFIHNLNATFLEDDGTHKDIIFPPEHESFEKYKVSLSFDAIRCDEPRTLNANEYCEISFGGSATLVNEKVKLGNDLIKIKVSKDKIVVANDDTQNIVFPSNAWYLEPLETPSGLNANTNPNQLVSNLFKTNSHTDSVALTIQYTFIIDETKEILSQWFDYGRYGTQGITVNDISPNMIYEITEYWSSWGVYSPKTFKAKLVENVDNENTESDTMTLSLTFQIQGENN